MGENSVSMLKYGEYYVELRSSSYILSKVMGGTTVNNKQDIVAKNLHYLVLNLWSKDY